MGLGSRPEEIEHRFTALQSNGSGNYVMVIKGQVDAVLAVAKKLFEEENILGYRRHSATETALVFPAETLRHNKPLDVFRPIHDAAWQIIDPRGQHR